MTEDGIYTRKVVTRLEMSRKNIIKGKERILADLHGWGAILSPTLMQAHGHVRKRGEHDPNPTTIP
jgi:hypothetical protein